MLDNEVGRAKTGPGGGGRGMAWSGGSGSEGRLSLLADTLLAAPTCNTGGSWRLTKEGSNSLACAIVTPPGTGGERQGGSAICVFLCPIGSPVLETVFPHISHSVG